MRTVKHKTTESYLELTEQLGKHLTKLSNSRQDSTFEEKQEFAHIKQKFISKSILILNFLKFLDRAITKVNYRNESKRRVLEAISDELYEYSSFCIDRIPIK